MRPEVKVSRPRASTGSREYVEITVPGCYGETLHLTLTFIGSESSYEGEGDLQLTVKGEQSERAAPHVVLYGDMDVDDERITKSSRWASRPS